MNTIQPQEPAVLNTIAEAVTKGQHGVIVIPLKMTIDNVCAATALYMGLTKLGKNISLIATQKPATDILGAEKFGLTFATTGDNLTISFPYTEGSVDKVDYNIEQGMFNVIVYPVAGQEKLSPEAVQFSYTGGKADFVITLDAPSLNGLGTIYTENQQEFQGVTLINVDRHLVNTNFGTINFVDKTSSSICEMALKMLISLRSEIDRDIATNLFRGLSSVTNSFSSYSVKSETFEAAAFLLKMGAVRKFPQTQSQDQKDTKQTPSDQKQSNETTPQSTQEAPSKQTPQETQTQSGSAKQPPQSSNPDKSQKTESTTPNKQSAQTEPAAVQNSGNQQPDNRQTSAPQQSTPDTPATETPQDWLKPKIFKGGTGLV